MAGIPLLSTLPLIILTALVLSLTTLAQILTSYTSAYLSAPQELHTFLAAADSCTQENESYDRDITKVPHLEDKLRLAHILREIQAAGDNLREDLNRLLIDPGGARMRSNARLLWAAKRAHLEDRVRRLDLLRMRFLVVYLGLVAAGVPGSAVSSTGAGRDAEKAAMARSTVTPNRPVLPHALTEGITRKQGPPLRRLTTQAMGHSDSVGGGQKMGWLGVVQELQRSPLMHKRHASIETAMASAKPP